MMCSHGNPEFQYIEDCEGSQGITIIESIIFNPCDGVGDFDPHQGFTTHESTCLDGSNGRSNDDFRDIFRDKLTKEALISVDYLGVTPLAGASNVYNAHDGYRKSEYRVLVVRASLKAAVSVIQ